jgi:hypothetical protein
MSRVRRCIVASVAFLVIATGIARADEPCVFKNEDVLKLVGAGLADNVILALMARCQGEFDTSPAALADLKGKGVSDAVLAAMVNPPAPAPPAPATAPANATAANGASPAVAGAEPPALEELGTYVAMKNGQVRKLATITTTSKGSAGRVTADILVPFAGLARRRHKQTIPGTAAATRIPSADLDAFYYFTSPGSPVDTSTLRLVAAEIVKEKDLRILGATLSSVTGGQTQEENSIPITLKVTKVPGLYKVTLAEALPKGEYAIVFGQFGQTRTFAIHDVWDFGLD